MGFHPNCHLMDTDAHTLCFTSWPVWTGLKEGERKCLQAQEAAKKIIPIMLITFQTLTISFKILVMKISIFHLVSTVTQRHWLWQIHPIKPMLFSPFLCLFDSTQWKNQRFCLLPVLWLLLFLCWLRGQWVHVYNGVIKDESVQSFSPCHLQRWVIIYNDASCRNAEGTISQKKGGGREEGLTDVKQP